MQSWGMKSIPFGGIWASNIRHTVLKMYFIRVLSITSRNTNYSSKKKKKVIYIYYIYLYQVDTQ